MRNILGIKESLVVQVSIHKTETKPNPYHIFQGPDKRPMNTNLYMMSQIAAQDGSHVQSSAKLEKEEGHDVV